MGFTVVKLKSQKGGTPRCPALLPPLQLLNRLWFARRNEQSSRSYYVQTPENAQRPPKRIFENIR